MKNLYLDPDFEPDAIFEEQESILEWRESEFVYHQKSPLWFAATIGISLVLGIGLFFLLGQDIFVFVVVAILSLIHI